MISIGIDVMGGDKGIKELLEGTIMVAKRHQEESIQFVIYGNVTKYSNHELFQLPNISIKHCENYIKSDIKASTALRQSKDTSMRCCIEDVRDGKIVACVSTGNTGALMAISKIILKTISTIDRPAIAGIVPTANKGKCIMLDMGANIECSSENYFQFAIMGSAFCTALLEIESPRIGILNIGSEDIKGHDHIRDASDMISESFLKDQFIGFVEPEDILMGRTDVVVTDGFTGNIFIKTAEATGKLIKNIIKKSLYKNIIRKLVAFLLYLGLFRKMLHKIDPRKYNGGFFVGLNGIVVKSHGGSDKVSFANAIEMSIMLCKNDINNNIAQKIDAEMGFK